jgi:Fur family transcriptional regulator, ferric uptake regulator
VHHCTVGKGDPPPIIRVKWSRWHIEPFLPSFGERVSEQPTSFDAVEVSQSPIQRFEEYLQSRKLRQTDQRRFLVEQVFSRHEHFDADQLIDQLPRKGQPNYVSRPTVYRTLKEFVDAGLLRSFELNGRSVYEHDYGYPEHDHFYCVTCHQLLEFRSEQLTQIRDQIAREHRFRVRSHRFIIQGVCDECSRKKSHRRRQDLV